MTSIGQGLIIGSTTAVLTVCIYVGLYGIFESANHEEFHRTVPSSPAVQPRFFKSAPRVSPSSNARKNGAVNPAITTHFIHFIHCKGCYQRFSVFIFDSAEVVAC